MSTKQTILPPDDIIYRQKRVLTDKTPGEHLHSHIPAIPATGTPDEYVSKREGCRSIFVLCEKK